MTLVRHPEVESVGPDWDAVEGGGDGGVVDKKLVCHHFELFVAADAEEGGADSDD